MHGSAQQPLACVLGEVDVVRALGLAGVRSAVAADAGEPVRYSRHTAATLKRTDPRGQPEATAAALAGFAAAQTLAPVLFYDADFDLLLVSRHRDELAGLLRFVIPDRDLVETLVDKARFQELAERLGLPVPAARRLADDGDLPAALDLRFPLIVKPLTRHHDFWRAVARGKAVEVTNRDALAALWERTRGATSMLAQETVPGPERRIESYHVYVDADGERAGEFTGRKLRTWPTRLGYTTALEITAAADVRELGRELVARLGLRGVAKLDFKRDPDGTLWLLEVNPRFNLWHHPGAIAGVNIPALVYGDLTGRPRPPRREARAGVRWCSLAHDLQAARAEGIGPLAWLGWALACEAKSGFALDDPLPLPAAVAARLAARLRRERRPLTTPGAEPG